MFNKRHNFKTQALEGQPDAPIKATIWPAMAAPLQFCRIFFARPVCFASKQISVQSKSTGILSLGVRRGFALVEAISEPEELAGVSRLQLHRWRIKRSQECEMQRDVT